jgi:hypothetical protein
MNLISVQKIWDKAPHNAFTDLILFQGELLCVLREGTTHVSADGSLRIISSSNGTLWESKATLSSPEADLRDGKLCITPEKQLMLCGAEKSKQGYQSMAWFSSDGISWSTPHKIGEPNFWLWRVTWDDDKAYSIGYHCGGNQFVRLYESHDGKHFSTLVDHLLDVGSPNESSIIFDNNKAYCLLRREKANGMLGIAKAPYSKWKWRNLKVPFGGPHMIRLPDGRFIAGVRLYDEKVRTTLCWLDPLTGTLTEALKLPSGGDTSYPGLLWHEGLLWVSYYSSHEGKASIYLAKVAV